MVPPPRPLLRISPTCRFLPLFLLSTLTLACSPSHTSRHPATLTRTEIYLGLSSPHGQVTPREFQDFLATSVTPHFPDGYTVLPAEGYYRYTAPNVTPLPIPKEIPFTLNPTTLPAPKTIHEPSMVLIILHDNSNTTNTAIEQIRHDYKFRFDQESTLRTDAKVTADFE